MTNKKYGGARKGAGRRRVPDSLKHRSCGFSLPPRIIHRIEWEAERQKINKSEALVRLIDQNPKVPKATASTLLSSTLLYLNSSLSLLLNYARRIKRRTINQKD